MNEARRSRMARSRILLTIFGVVVLGGLGYGLFTFFTGNSRAAETDINYSLVRPQRGAISATVNASGSMQPQELVNLNFATTGVVVQVLVDVGDIVQVGDTLARLDARELQLQVQQAQASLSQAEATYAQLKAEATPEELAQAQAQLQQAQAQLQQTQGAVTAQDIAAAQAQVTEARARLAQLEAGADVYDLEAARASLDRARFNLQSQRDSLSAAKTQAQTQMEQAANTVRDRQAEYSRIYWDNREIERTAGGLAGNRLSQSNRDREESALRAVRSAEAELDRARIAYEQAQRAEITGIQVAEADVRNAEATLDGLLQGAKPDELATARAQVVQAEANLAQLVGAERAGSIAAAVAGVQSSQANLEQLTAEPREVDLAGAVAQIQQAASALKQAELDLTRATLRATMAGVVAEENLQVGESPDTTQPAIVLADVSSFSVDVTVDEIDVARLAIDQSAELTLDALPELRLSGIIETINPLPSDEDAIPSYKVRITTQSNDPRVRAGMSANADIIVARKTDALIIPRRAAFSEDGKLWVDVPVNQALCDADTETWPAAPELQPVEITSGLRSEQDLEVATGDISEQTCIYIEGFDARMMPLSGPPPGRRGR